MPAGRQPRKRSVTAKATEPASKTLESSTSPKEQHAVFTPCGSKDDGGESQHSDKSDASASDLGTDDESSDYEPAEKKITSKHDPGIVKAKNGNQRRKRKNKSKAQEANMSEQERILYRINTKGTNTDFSSDSLKDDCDQLIIRNAVLQSDLESCRNDLLDSESRVKQHNEDIKLLKAEIYSLKATLTEKETLGQADAMLSQHFQEAPREINDPAIVNALLALPSIVKSLEGLLSRTPPVPAESDLQQDQLIFENQVGTMPATTEVLSESSLLSSIPATYEEKWTFFDCNVQKLKAMTEEEKLLALVHKEGSDGLYDIGKSSGVKCKEKTYFIHKLTIQRSASSANTLSAYAVRVFDAFMRREVTIFCTCNGTAKGASADGHARAGLPKEAFAVFIGHCLDIGRRMKFKSVDQPKEAEKQIRQAVNTHLQNLRLEFDFSPTEEQLIKYNQLMKRGGKRASKSNPNVEESL